MSHHVVQSTIAVGDVAHAVATDRRGSESVSAFGMNVRRDPTAEGERGQRMVVREQHDRMDQLG